MLYIIDSHDYLRDTSMREETWNDRLKLAFEKRLELDPDLNKSEIARRIGASKQAVGSWINKDPSRRVKSIDPYALLRVCKTIGADPYWVMIGEGSPESPYGDLTAIESVNFQDTFGYTPNYDHKNVKTYKVRNEHSFRPAIDNDDILFISTAERFLENGAIYLLKSIDAKTFFLRRYFTDPMEGTYAFVTGEDDDRTYKRYNKEDFECSLKNLEVIGKVIGKYTERL